HAPTPDPATTSVVEDGLQNISLSFSDPDAGDSASVIDITYLHNGVLTDAPFINGSASFTTDLGALVSVDAAGNVTYDASHLSQDITQTTADTFNYTVSDMHGAQDS